MTATLQVIDELRTNVSRLMECLQQERLVNQSLKKEMEILRKTIAEKEAAYEELVSKYNTLQVARTLAGAPTGDGNVKASIHNLVREIDKCIALLNR